MPWGVNTYRLHLASFPGGAECRARGRKQSVSPARRVAILVWSGSPSSTSEVRIPSVVSPCSLLRIAESWPEFGQCWLTWAWPGTLFMASPPRFVGRKGGGLAVKSAIEFTSSGPLFQVRSMAMSVQGIRELRAAPANCVVRWWHSRYLGTAQGEDDLPAVHPCLDGRD